MTMPLQDALRNGTHTIESLKTQLGINARRHKTYPQLVLFKYDMVESPMDNPICQHSRGTILDEADDWRIISYPFQKFFNLGEPGAANIDWQSAHVLEKVDGSLMQLYWYDGKWRVASSGSPDAAGSVGMLTRTFADLFWDIFLVQNMCLPSEMDRDITFLFELTAPENRVVCGYEGRKLTLLGARMRIGTHAELWPGQVSSWYNWPHVRDFSLNGKLLSPEGLQASFQTMDPMKQEGYVVVDRHFSRVKVKHPQYVLAHQLRGSWSPRAALEAVRQGELPELAVHFPEMKAQLDDIQERLQVLALTLGSHWLRLRDIPVQKDFALEAIRTPLGGAPLFSMRAGKVKTFSEFLKDMNVDRLAQELGLTTLNPKTPAELEDA